MVEPAGIWWFYWRGLGQWSESGQDVLDRFMQGTHAWVLPRHEFGVLTHQASAEVWWAVCQSV